MSPTTDDRLLAYALDPSDALTLAFAGALRTMPQAGDLGDRRRAFLMGLSRAGLTRLMDRYFPGAHTELVEGAACPTGCAPLRAEEYGDVLALLLEHRSGATEETLWLAHAIAAGCLGGNHLFEDMGLPSRQALSQLIEHHFKPLFVKNSANMKWKKFFYKQLCDRAEVNMCKAPSCGVCPDYRQCFAPQQASGQA